MRKRKMGTRARRPETSSYHNAYHLPSVNQMMTAGGAEYNDPNTMPRVFPVPTTSRIQTPINRVGAFITRYQVMTANDLRRGIMWCNHGIHKGWSG